MGLIDLTRFRGLGEWLSDRQLIRDNFDLLQTLLNGNLDAANLLATALPGHEINYTEITADVNITATTEASPTDVVSSGAITYDGTPILIEFFSPIAVVGSSAGSSLVINLWDGSTNLGFLGDIEPTANMIVPVRVARRLTPSAASHTYRIRAWRITSNGQIGAGAGGAGAYLPAFIRITKV